MDGELNFSGPTYDPKHDRVRLTNQHQKVKNLMLDGQWRTIERVAALVDAPASSVSAQIRNMRKKQFGGYVVNRRVSGDRSRGLYEYQVAGESSAMGRVVSEYFNEVLK